MGKRIKLARGEPQDHVAFQTWRTLRPEAPVPPRIEILKRKKGGAVFRLVAAGPRGVDVIAKGSVRHKAAVERALYEQVLPRLELPGPTLYGSLDPDPVGGWIWLFLEDIGPQRYVPSDTQHRTLATQWLAALHVGAERLQLGSSLPGRDLAHQLGHLQSVRHSIPRILSMPFVDSSTRTLLDSIRAHCEQVRTRWDRVADVCARAPRTIVHGDCLAKNVHLREQEGQLAVVPIDWGGAGYGPAATDLGMLGLPRHGDSLGGREHALYAEAVSPCWPDLDTSTIASLANLGRLFWALKVIARGLEEFEAEMHDPVQTTANLCVYAAELRAAAESARLTPYA